MSKQVILRPFKASDLGQVIELKVKLLRSSRSHDEAKRIWDWAFDGNPFSSSHIPHGWVLEHEGRIVGNIGQVAVPTKVGPRTIVSHACRDFAVEEGYRPYGIALASKFWRNAGAPFLVTTTASEAAYHIHKALGAKELISAKTTWLSVRRSKNILRMLLGRRKELGSKALDTDLLLTVVSSLVTHLVLGWGSHLTTSKGRLRLEEVREFGPEFDSFWQDVSPSYSVLVARDSRYLNWRYVQYPLSKPHAFAAHDASGKLRGFTIVQLSVFRDMRVAEITEIFTRSGDQVAQQDLLYAALSYASKQEADVITVARCSPEIGRLLRKNLFLRRRLKYSPYLYRDNQGISPDVLADERNWFISTGDPDSSF